MIYIKKKKKKKIQQNDKEFSPWSDGIAEDDFFFNLNFYLACTNVDGGVSVKVSV